MPNEKGWGQCKALHTRFLDPKSPSGPAPLPAPHPPRPVRMSVGSESLSIMPVEFPPIVEYYSHCNRLCFGQNTHCTSLPGPSLWDDYLSCVLDTCFGQKDMSWNGTSHFSPDAWRAVACLHHLSSPSATEHRISDWASPSALVPKWRKNRVELQSSHNGHEFEW